MSKVDVWKLKRPEGAGIRQVPGIPVPARLRKMVEAQRAILRMTAPYRRFLRTLPPLRLTTKESR